MWPFSKKEAEPTEVSEFKGVKFGNLFYKPQADISPYEVSMLLPIFINVYVPIDRKGYILKHKLERHFEEELPNEKFY
jgi:hypothetical protein